MFPRALAFETRMRSFEPRAPVITKKHPARIGIFHWTQSNKFFIAKFSFFLPFSLAQMDSFLAIAVAFLVTLAFSCPVARSFWPAPSQAGPTPEVRD